VDEAAIAQRIREIIAETFPDVPGVMDADHDTNLFHDVPLNSFSVMGLLVRLEDEFSIVVENNDMRAQNIRSIAAITALVTRYQAAARP
jgi:acyl carrier protein